MNTNHYPTISGQPRPIEWQDGALGGTRLHPTCGTCGELIHNTGTGRGSRWVHGIDPHIRNAVVTK